MTATEREGDAGIGAETGLLGLHGADTGLEGHQLGEAAGIEGEFLNLGAVDGGADVGRGGVDLGGAGFDADGVGDGADGELGVDADGLRGADIDVVGFGFLEAGFFEGEGVGAGGDLGQEVVAGGVGEGFAAEGGIVAGDADGGAGDGGAGGIGDGAEEGAVVEGLGEGSGDERKKAGQKNAHEELYIDPDFAGTGGQNAGRNQGWAGGCDWTRKAGGA